MTVENISKGIRFVRVAADMKQKDMAERLGVTQNYLSLVENGKKEPSLSFLRKVSEEFDVPISFLLLEGTVDFESKRDGYGNLFEKFHELIMEFQKRRIQEASQNGTENHAPNNS